MNGLSPSDRVLTELRLLRDQARDTSLSPAPGSDFSKLLRDAVDQVNALQTEAASAAEGFERGETDASLAEVMIGLQKASVAFQAMVQVRNKLVEAYKDVMNMPM